MCREELRRSLYSNLFSAYLVDHKNRSFTDWESENRVIELILKDIEFLLEEQDKKYGHQMMHPLQHRFYKSELVDLLSDITIRNENFNMKDWSLFDAERLIKAGELIKSQLENDSRLSV